MPEKSLEEMSDDELEFCYNEALNKLPSRAPIFLPTERMPMKMRIKGVKRVDHIYKNTLNSVYRPKLKALRKKHKGAKRCFIIGNGPSLNETDLELLKGEVTFAVNGFFLKAKELSWTPTYYVVEDHLVAEDRLEWINEFKGPTKLFPAYLGYCFEESDDTIFYNHRPRVSYPDGFDFSTDAAKITYTGCTVTFSCMQLAHYMGFEEIYLIGVDASYEIPADVDDSDDYNVGVLDMKSDDTNHFHPDYFGKGFRWHDPQVHKMIDAYKEARKITDGTGRMIYNATVGGKLEVFERVAYESLFSKDLSSASSQPLPMPHLSDEEYPRVLIYDITLSGNGTATGEVKANLFQDWPKDKLGQFYSTGREQFGWHTHGQNRGNKLSSQEAIDRATSFDPDVILYRPVLDNLELHKAAMNAIGRLKKPFVTWYMDDWPERFKTEDPKRFANFSDDLTYLIEASNKTLVIGDMMAKAYGERYGREFIPLANGVDKADWPQPILEEIKGRSFKVRYAGSLAENMTQNSLLRVAEAVEKLSEDHDVVFEIKTLQIWHDKVKAKFKAFTKTSFLVENLSIEDYRGWIRGADTLIIAYNFDARSKVYTQYSVANKMPECLASGIPILAHGPHDVATIDLLQNNDCAVIVSEPDAELLAQSIENLITSLPLRKKISQQGRLIAFKNHNLLNLKPQLKELFVEASQSSGALPASASAALAAPQSHAIVLGNGASLKGFDFSKFDGHVVFGMNAAYRYWDQIGWYPDYYSCLDVIVGLSHKAEIKRLIENSPEYGIKKFLLRDNLILELGRCKNADRIVNFDTLRAQHKALNSPTITTGSHTAAWAATFGFKRLFLMGVDCNYLEIVDGAVKQKGGELLIKEEKSNPNYFFEGYQKKGDKYNIPNPERDIHLQSWQEVKWALDSVGTQIFNTNLSSNVDIFDFHRFEDIEIKCAINGINKDDELTSVKALSQIVYPREAQAGFDETFLIFKMYEDKAPGVMLDVGAHYGGSARPFVGKGWSVFCQEPDPSNRAHLVKSLGNNSLVKIDPRAVGEAPETNRAFYSSDESTGISGMLAFRDTHKQSATVDVTTVKNIIDDNNIAHVDFLKIDVEGYDFGVLKGVPWEHFKPDVIECEFEDAKTKHLGHTWRDICDYLSERGYTVYVSEWHPIVRYGISHDWCALKKYPCELDDVDAWGNLLAFKTDPGEVYLCEKLEQVMKLRNESYNKAGHVSPSGSAAKPTPRVSSGPPASAANKPSVSSKRDLLSNNLRQNNPVLFRIAQFGKIGLEFLRRHIVITILGATSFCGLIFGPVFIEALKPFAFFFWILAAVLLGVFGTIIGLSFGNMMANRIAVREMVARQNLKNEILSTLENKQKDVLSTFEQRQKEVLSTIEQKQKDVWSTVEHTQKEVWSGIEKVNNTLEATSRAEISRLEHAIELAQKTLEDEVEARRALSLKVTSASDLSEAAMAKIEEQDRRNSTSFMLAHEQLEGRMRAHEQLEGRLSHRLEVTEKGLKKAHNQLALKKVADEKKAVNHQHFNRSLNRQQIKVFKDKWLKPLNLQETDKSLAYMAEKIGNIEKNVKGRLATSIEDAVLRTLVAKSVNGKTLKVLEIGVLFGVSLAMIYDRTVDKFDTIKITALDPFEGYYGDNALDIVTQERITRKVFVENMEVARVPTSAYKLIEGYSADDDVIKAASKDVYDVLIIDGDHSYAGVKSDFVNYAPMVKRGGYILIDDDSAPEWPEITKYVDDELIPRADITLIGRSWRTAVFKVIKKIKT